MSEQEFIKKSKELTHVIVQVLGEHTEDEDTELGLKMSLLAMSKASAALILIMQEEFDADGETSLLDLFLGTVSASVKLIGKSENSTKKIIDKMMGKQ